MRQKKKTLEHTVVETLHLWPGGPGFKPASLQNFKGILQGSGCPEIPFPRPHLVWEL
jgi:hypothetical protein